LGIVHALQEAVKFDRLLCLTHLPIFTLIAQVL
jgi:hypothetical protein